MNIICDLQFLGVRSMQMKDGTTAYEVNFYDLENQQTRSFFVGGQSDVLKKLPSKAPCMLHCKIGVFHAQGQNGLYRLRLLDVQA